jgi:hypothetical protein
MNDLTMLNDLGAALDPATDEPPARLRHRVLKSFEGPARRRRRLRVSLGWSLATSGGLAVALAVALVAGGAGGSGRSGNRPDTTLTASDVLLKAAATVRADKTPPPRPDQLVFSQSISAYAGSTSGPDGKMTVIPAVPKMRKIWLSVDGTHDGLLRESTMPGAPSPAVITLEHTFPGCVNGKQAVVDGNNTVHRDRFEKCKAHPAYNANLPTDAKGMLAYLKTRASLNTDQYIFNAVEEVIGEHYRTPAQLAAIFEAAALIQSVVVVPDVVDIAGRHGIAVALQLGPFDPTGATPDHLNKPTVIQHQLVFDKTTYRFLGYQAVAVANYDGHKPGDVLSAEARLKNGIVDKIGQEL